MSDKGKTQMKFEDNLNELEKLVRSMESGELKLDEMIAAFEKGRGLVKTCQDDLESIRLRIEKVTASGSAEPVAVVKNASGEDDVAL